MNFYCLDDIPEDLRKYFEIAPQLGLEKTPEEYIAKMVEVFREVKRVLRNDGTLWVNIGDTYAVSGTKKRQINSPKQISTGVFAQNGHHVDGLKPKDLIGIPWMLAFALRAGGWYLRSDIIWCLSGGVWLYVKTKKGEMPMMLRDAARLDPRTVKLWNGEKWTQVLGWSRTSRNADELELVLRSGERISCTPNHKFKTTIGLLYASEIKVGDVLESVILPEPEIIYSPTIIDNEDVAWFVGLYLAEGSRSGECIQIAGHIQEHNRWERVQRVAKHFGGSATITNIGNTQNIRVYGRFIVALIENYISGRDAKTKAFKVKIWSHSNAWLREVLNGYLGGDGHWDEPNKRWRLGFCRNYNLERDLRTLSARLGFKLKLTLSEARNQDGIFPSFRGELRFVESDHFNIKNQHEVMEIRRARCREVYDVGVADEPHLFALASGILTHNSKPNPMPESVTDRPTKSHEYIFLFSKSERYYYDYKAIMTDISSSSIERLNQDIENQTGSSWVPGKTNGTMKARASWNGSDFDSGKTGEMKYTRGGKSGNKARKDRPGPENDSRNQQGSVPWEGMKANKRDVWTVVTMPYKEAHFATFPQELIVDCIKAGCPVDGLVLDPFLGSGTTAIVARKLNRNYIGIELNPKYVKMAQDRIYKECGMFS